jgi:SAM-dependent methyltransferase
MNDQQQYWEARILTWEQTAYSGESRSSVSMLDRIATPFRRILVRRLETATSLVRDQVRGQVVVDCGCASGGLLRALLPYGPKKLIGLDISSSAVSAATEAANELGASDVMEFVQADIRQDSTVIEEADLVLGIGFIDYLSPAEMESFVKALSGKLFLFSFPHRRMGLREALHPIYLKLAGCPGAYKYSGPEMDAILGRAGLAGWWYYDRDNIRFVTNLPRGSDAGQ